MAYGCRLSALDTLFFSLNSLEIAQMCRTKTVRSARASVTGGRKYPTVHSTETTSGRPRLSTRRHPRKESNASGLGQKRDIHVVGWCCLLDPIDVLNQSTLQVHARARLKKNIGKNIRWRLFVEIYSYDAPSKPKTVFFSVVLHSQSSNVQQMPSLKKVPPRRRANGVCVSTSGKTSRFVCSRPQERVCGIPSELPFHFFRT